MSNAKTRPWSRLIPPFALQTCQLDMTIMWTATCGTAFRCKVVRETQPKMQLGVEQAVHGTRSRNACPNRVSAQEMMFWIIGTRWSSIIHQLEGTIESLLISFLVLDFIRL
jgi:hypothetical protein